MNYFEDIDPELLARWKIFHINNRHIWLEFRDRALAMSEVRRKYSAWVIINVMRWEHDIQTRGDEFKINNDYIALYARLFAHHYPHLAGFFNLKQMKRVKRLPNSKLR